MAGASSRSFLCNDWPVREGLNSAESPQLALSLQRTGVSPPQTAGGFSMASMINAYLLARIFFLKSTALLSFPRGCQKLKDFFLQGLKGN